MTVCCFRFTDHFNTVFDYSLQISANVGELKCGCVSKGWLREPVVTLTVYLHGLKTHVWVFVQYFVTTSRAVCFFKKFYHYMWNQPIFAYMTSMDALLMHLTLKFYVGNNPFCVISFLFFFLVIIGQTSG